MDAYTIIAQDGADDDGGTLYTLYDDLFRIVAAAAWPQPLEEIAAERGYSTRRRRPVIGLFKDEESHVR